MRRGVRTHAGAVDVDLLLRGGAVVEEEQATVLDVEAGAVVVITLLASGALVLHGEHQVALPALDGVEVDGAGGAEGEEAEDVQLGLGSSRGGRDGAGGSEERGSNGELHLVGV